MNGPPRLTTGEIRKLLLQAKKDPTNVAPQDADTARSNRSMLQTFIGITDRAQVFDFGSTENIGETNRKLAADLWQRRLLRLPFPVTVFSFRQHGRRITMLCLDDIEISVGNTIESTHCTGFILMSQGDDWARVDAFTWFEVPDNEHVKAGATPLSECANETERSFKNYTLAAVARVMTLCMLLNTKGIHRRHDPVPVKLNAKRARSGKEPLDAVTYVDLHGVTFTEGALRGHGGEKSMHLRRGHIRHYDDGSVTWVRDCVVKGDGDLKQRERYQVREV